MKVFLTSLLVGIIGYAALQVFWSLVVEPSIQSGSSYFYNNFEDYVAAITTGLIASLCTVILARSIPANFGKDFGRGTASGSIAGVPFAVGTMISAIIDTHLPNNGVIQPTGQPPLPPVPSEVVILIGVVFGILLMIVSLAGGLLGGIISGASRQIMARRTIH